MIHFENAEIFGWDPATRGMRNPMNSWDKSDSYILDDKFVAGDNDLSLMKRLVDAGTDHRKFMRMITVYVDITAPLYWWKEFDTYKVGTVSNSCSTMHKIQTKEFGWSNFSFEHIDNTIACALPDEFCTFGEDDDDKIYMTEVAGIILAALNECRDLYLQTKDKRYWWQMIQLLPSSYNQRRTIMLNYEVLANIYKSRRGHKLDEWREFCSWSEKLPYFKEMVWENEC